jgi:hypothetical protein
MSKKKRKYARGSSSHSARGIFLAISPIIEAWMQRSWDSIAAGRGDGMPVFESHEL